MSCTYLVIKSPCLHWYLTDENIYYYLSRDLTFGNLPYRDFFYANPPLLLVLFKATGSIFGWGVLGLRAVPVGATLLGGWVIYRTLKPQIGGTAVIPLCVFWLTYDALRASTHATGINVTLLFLVTAYLFAFRGRGAASGVILGLGLWTKAYAIVAFPGIVFALFFAVGKDRWREIVRFLAVVLISVFLLALLGTLAGGKAFWDMTLWYHLGKTVGSSGLEDTAERVLGKNRGTLWVVALVGLFALAVALRRPSAALRAVRETTWVQVRRLTASPPGVLFLVGTIHLMVVFLFLFLQRRVFDFYFLLYLPGAVFVLGGLLAWVQPKPDPTENRTGWRVAISALATATLFVLAQPLLPQEERIFLKESVSYWSHEGRTIDRLQGLSEAVKQPQGATLCGDSTSASLLALLSGATLALGEADTNAMRFRAGYPPPDEFIRRLEVSRVERLLVRTERRGKSPPRPVGMFGIVEFLRYADENFALEGVLQLNSKDEVRLLRRR